MDVMPNDGGCIVRWWCSSYVYMVCEDVIGPLKLLVVAAEFVMLMFAPLVRLK